jgi:hypothetical protein
MASWSARLADNATIAPACKRACANAAPIPLEAPTSQTRLPVQEVIGVFSGFIMGEEMRDLLMTSA